ncbi:MAG: hypothetical protein CSA58_07980 [Micrococcales bacterium]|nr:MAG: hypothetical protein CSB46_09020 [Micrococcales bacterium]PIE26728.1 MAG: hypothetical protein CSA58_07980 [Micrococcales bacterium]
MATQRTGPASSTPAKGTPQPADRNGSPPGRPDPQVPPGPPSESAGAVPAAGDTVSADPGAPRTVRLSLARIDPWSAMKITFLLSVALGIASVVASFLLWTLVNGMGVFGNLNDFIRTLSNNNEFNISDYVGLTRVLSMSTVLAVANVVLLTALGTLGALLYNICAALVGGVDVTLTDD